MKWLAIAVEVIGGLCLLIVLLGALRGVLDVPRLTFIRKFDEATKYPYFGLALLGIGLLIVGFFPDLKLTSVDVWGLKAQVGNLETKVANLSEQMEAFFKQKRTEIFDKDHNWDRVRVERTKTRQAGNGWDYKLALTLEQEPIKQSVDALWGALPVTDLEVDGKVVTMVFEGMQEDLFPLPPENSIRVTYYPRTAK